MSDVSNPVAVENCPFCQTVINAGAVVCTGCQANYRSKGVGAVSLAFGLFGIMLIGIGAVTVGLMGKVIPVLIGSGFCYLAFRMITKKMWYRRMH